MNLLCPIPQHRASVKVTLEDVSKGGRTPAEIATVWRRYSVLIQSLGDTGEAETGRLQLEDPHDNLRLLRVDLSDNVLAALGAIHVCFAAVDGDVIVSEYLVACDV